MTSWFKWWFQLIFHKSKCDPQGFFTLLKGKYRKIKPSFLSGEQPHTVEHANY